MKKSLIILGLILSSNILMADNDNYQYKTVYVDVLKSEPIYTNIEKKYPIEECVDKKVIIRHNNNSIGVDTLIGGVLGVALGNQIGKGSGRDAAKVVGGISGALIANNMRNNNHNNDYTYKTICNKKYRYEHVSRLSGYKNYFIINGEKYFKISDRKLNRVKINLTYSW
jgi:uncharacterized protein YcfJ